MEMKAKVHSTLETILGELDSLIDTITFSSFEYRDLCPNILLRFFLAKNLLTAETKFRSIDSVEEEEEDESLKLASKRLTELEEAFMTSQSSGHNYGSLIEPETGTCASNEDDDLVVDSETGSVYSCQDDWPSLQYASSEEAKAKVHSTLATILGELDSLIDTITFSSFEYPDLCPNILLRFFLAKNLLTDVEGEEEEDESLKLASKRLTELEEAFITTQSSGHDYGSLIEPETRCLETNDENEVGKAEEEEDDEDWTLLQDTSEEEVKGRVGFRALVCYGLIGLVGGMISLFGLLSDNMKEDQFCPVPPQLPFCFDFLI